MRPRTAAEPFAVGFADRLQPPARDGLTGKTRSFSPFWIHPVQHWLVGDALHFGLAIGRSPVRQGLDLVDTASARDSCAGTSNGTSVSTERKRPPGTELSTRRDRSRAGIAEEDPARDARNGKQICRGWAVPGQSWRCFPTGVGGHRHPPVMEHPEGLFRGKSCV